MRRLPVVAAVVVLMGVFAVPPVQAAFTARTSASLGVSSAASFYAAAVLADRPVLYWRLGEASGTTAADAKGTYPGTYGGTVTLGTAGHTRDGDTAVTLTGAGYVGTTTSALDFNGTAPFSLEAWAEVTDGSTYDYGRIFSNELTNAQGRQGYDAFRCPQSWASAGSTCYCFERFRDGTSDGVCSGDVTLNAWHHLVFSYDGSTVRLYVDGSLRGSSTATKSMSSRNIGMKVGNGANAFAGLVDEVAVYDVALSASSVAAHYARGG